jgi:hypothetical protein
VVTNIAIAERDANQLYDQPIQQAAEPAESD